MVQSVTLDLMHWQPSDRHCPTIGECMKPRVTDCTIIYIYK